MRMCNAPVNQTDIQKNDRSNRIPQFSDLCVVFPAKQTFRVTFSLFAAVNLLTSKHFHNIVSVDKDHMSSYMKLNR